MARINKGFTLAEVLVTLGIIGTIAAMTIPNLVQNIQDKEFKTAAKAAFSKASQAVQQMKLDEGGSLAYYYTTYRSFKPNFMKYFKVVQDCNWSDCVVGADASTIYKTMNGDPGMTWRFRWGQFVTTDGMFWGFQNAGSAGDGGGYINVILITIDVNGYGKGPNVFGRDVFMFQLKNDILVPMGASNSYWPSQGLNNPNDSCSKGQFTVGYRGLGCMYYVMQGIDY